MNTAYKSYRFCVEPDAPIATLEAALAVVRRLGIELRGMRTTATPQGWEVLLRLAAPEEDALTLCRMRLHNLIGVQAIREQPALVSSLTPPVSGDVPAIASIASIAGGVVG